MSCSERRPRPVGHAVRAAMNGWRSITEDTLVGVAVTPMVVNLVFRDDRRVAVTVEEAVAPVGVRRRRLENSPLIFMRRISATIPG